MEESDQAVTVRLADWLMGALVERGIEQAFMVTGGGAMHLDDAAGLCDGLTVTCVLHEQAAAIASEAYAKVAGRLALCLVTAGPGGTNAITGVAGGWLDSTPMLVISGQVKRADLVGSTGVRQRGVQELALGALVGSITKYTALVLEPTEIRYQLERALYLAQSGRPGPVWLEIPLDVQAAPIDPAALRGFDPDELDASPVLEGGDLERAARSVADRLASAERPVVLLGSGVRLARAERRVLELVDRLGAPVLTTWPAMGIVGEDHPLYVGRPGSLAPRGANFALQSADLLLAIGARLDMVTTGYDPKDFGRHAHKVVVDVDPKELAKLEGAIDDAICADAGAFVAALQEQLPAESGVTDAWRARCRAWRDAYPIVLPEHRRLGEHVSTYLLADVVSDLLADDDVLAPCSSGLAIEIFLLALRLRTGHRATLTTALGAMGYGPPSAIGACLASGRKRTICLDGDGGLQMNVQELETIRRLDLPIKLLVMANDGYASIRSSQRRWFGRVVGADPASGVTLPPLDRLAAGFGIPYVRIDASAPLEPQLRAVLERVGPVLCEVPTPPDEPRVPSQVSEATPDGGMRSRPIEDLAPLLPRDELAANLPYDVGSAVVVAADGTPRIGDGRVDELLGTDRG